MIQLCSQESSIAFMIEKIRLVTRSFFVEIMDWPNYLERANETMREWIMDIEVNFLFVSF